MRLFAAVLLICAFTANVRAEGDDSAARQAAREHYRKGSVAYELGHYDVAVSEYEAAYQAFNEPTLLYNLGQAHRLAKHFADALHFYRMYLIKVPDAANRAEVEAKIGSLQAALAQAPAPPPVVSKRAPATEPTPTVAPTKAEEAPPPIAPAPAAIEDRAKARTLKVSGLVVGIVGLGLVGGGVGVGLIAKKAGDDISAADANHQPFDPAKYSTYQSDQIVAGVLIGVGGAAVVTGTVLAIVGVRRGRVQVAPQVSAGRASVTASLRF